MDNQISLVERGAFDDLKELERLWEPAPVQSCMCTTSVWTIFLFLCCSLCCCCCLFPAAVAWTRTASASCQSCCSRRTTRWPDCKSANLPLLCLNFCRVVAAHKWLEDWDIRPQTQLVLYFQLGLSFWFCSCFGCVSWKLLSQTTQWGRQQTFCCHWYFWNWQFEKLDAKTKATLTQTRCAVLPSLGRPVSVF